MKSLPCCNPNCNKRRIHHEQQDVMRETRMVEVDDDTTVYDAVFCSITCACMDGWMSLKYNPTADAIRHAEWQEKHKKRLDSPKPDAV